MKKALLCLLLMAVIGCSGQSEKSAKSKDDTNLRLGIAHCCAQKDLFMWFMGAGIKKEASEKGITNTFFENAEDNQNSQYNQIEKLISQNIQALILSLVVDDTSKKPYQQKVFDMAKNHNLPIVLYTIQPRSLFLSTYPNLYYVGSIPAQSGIDQGQLIVKQWKKNKSWDKNNDGVIQYVILKGPDGNPDAEDRTKWVTATIQNYPSEGIKAEQLALKSAYFRRKEAKEVITEWIANGTLAKAEVIISNNDDMALGALDALEENNLYLPIFGVDAVPEALKNIKNKKMAGTVLQDSQGQIQAAVTLATNLAAGREPGLNLKTQVVDRTVMIPYVAIDLDNVDQYIK